MEGEKRIRLFRRVDDFFPIMLGEGGSYFKKDDLFCLLSNYLPDRAAARNAFLFSWRRADWLMGDLILIP